MAKILSCGKINKQYKYMLFYVIIKIVNDYFFSDLFPKQIKPEVLEPNNYPPNILIQIFFNYIGGFIFSSFLYLYQKKQGKNKIKEESQIQRDSLSKHTLIYDQKKPNYKNPSIYFTIALLIISLELIAILSNVGFWSILYWTFDIFFVSYINNLMFGIEIYSHKKLAIIIMIIFCTIFKFVSTYVIISNDEYNLFYKNHIILIPIIIILYIFLSLIRFYSLCKMKYLLDYKFIPETIFFFLYNSVGIIILLVPCLIFSFVQCKDKAELNDVDLICTIKIEAGDKIEYYFDSFSYFFEQLWRKDKNVGLNILYLFLFIIRLLLNALQLLYTILIIRHLNPEYYYCAYNLYCNLVRIASFINAIVNDGNIYSEIYNACSEFGSLIGMLIYLEFIDLKFCKLNFNLRKNIQNRSEIDYNIDELLSEKEENENENENN